MMNSRRAFTLVEVAVAGSLIGLCVLTAVSIIPQGLRVQDEARMRAAAAATVMSLSARAGIGTSITNSSTMSDVTTAMDPRIIAWDSSNSQITHFDTALGQNRPLTPFNKIYQVNPLPAQNSGDLSRRLIFTTIQSRTGVVLAWLLSKDPGQSSMRATYLTTFTENM